VRPLTHNLHDERVARRPGRRDPGNLADAIRRNPWGPAARTVEVVVGWGEQYGVDALLSNVIRRAREDYENAKVAPTTDVLGRLTTSPLHTHTANSPGLEVLATVVELRGCTRSPRSLNGAGGPAWDLSFRAEA
jgi:hypothetical protein